MKEEFVHSVAEGGPLEEQDKEARGGLGHRKRESNMCLILLRALASGKGAKMVMGPLSPSGVRGRWKEPQGQRGSAVRREGHVVTQPEGLTLWPSPLITGQGVGDAELSGRRGPGSGVDC